MEDLYAFGVDLAVALQSLPWLEAPMRFFTFLGTQDFFMLLLPVIYWCIDSALGVRVGYILLLGNSFSALVKMVLQQPRPYWVSPTVRAMVTESNFGAPSGHALMAVAIWGTLASAFRKPWAWLSAAVLAFLIGVSRLYLGVHFLQDTLLGWILGGLLLWAFLAWWQPVGAWVSRRTLMQQLLLCFVPSLIALGPSTAVAYANLDYQLPAAWMANAMRAAEPFPAPFALKGAITSAGTLFGLSLGLVLMSRLGGFRAGGAVWRRLLCFLIGIIGLGALEVGLSAALPSGDVMRFVHFAALGAWVSAGAPWLFLRLGLVPSARV